MSFIFVIKKNTYNLGYSNVEIIYLKENTNISINSNETLTEIGVMNPGKVMQYDIISNVDITESNFFKDYDYFVFSNDNISTEKKDITVTYEEAYKMCINCK